MTDDPTVRAYTWEEIDRLCLELAGRVRASGFQPEAVVGIVRGGLFPALMLAHAFDTRELYTLNVATTVDEQIGSARRATPEVFGQFKIPSLVGKKVLVVDDVTNSGMTMTAARDAVLASEPGEVKTACPVWDRLLTSTDTHSRHCRADFWVDTIDAWALFPWEKVMERA